MATCRVCLLVLFLALLPVSPALADQGGTLLTPVPGAVLAPFEAPGHRYGPGHRGVDLAAPAGTEVRAAADGIISFSGPVAGRWSVSVLHPGGLRTTYTPVRGRLPVGSAVDAGETVGQVTAGSHCPSSCLHWGLTDGVDYFDPLPHLREQRVTLLPLGSAPRAVPALPGIGRARLPIDGRVTSRFGMRRHPITGRWKLHDGVDLAAPCGTVVRSVLPGVVSRSDTHPAYGHRVEVTHGDGSRTTYAHLQAPGARRGALLAAGEQLGKVGSTGASTGCHLHLMLSRGGRVMDPLTVLPGR